MATNKQTEANKNNSLLGGVKTKKGKKISRLNATKYGFFSQIVTQHDKILNNDFCDEMYEAFLPQNIYEAQLVEMILSNLLSYRRICLVESALIKNELNKSVYCQESVLEDFSLYDTSYQKKFRETITDEILKFQRYKTSVLNLMVKAQHELERLIRMRSGEFVPAPTSHDINMNAQELGSFCNKIHAGENG